MSKALASPRAPKKAAAPERARQSPAETRPPPIADGPLPLQTLLYLQRFAGNAALVEMMEATRERAAPNQEESAPKPAETSAGPGLERTERAEAPAASALSAPFAAAGIGTGIGTAVYGLGSMLGGLIAPAPGQAPAKGKPTAPPAEGKEIEHSAPREAPAPAAATATSTEDGGEPAVAETAASPETDPHFLAVKDKVHARGAQAKSHAPAHAKVAEAHGAAVGPANEIASQAGAAKVEKMSAQQPGGFDKPAFMAAVRKAIDASAPHNLEEAGDFKDSGKAGQIQGQVSGLVGQNKQQAEGAIKVATEAPPDTTAAKPKPVTPMPAEQPGAPPAAIGAASAMPTPKPAEEVSLAKGPAEVNASMEEAEVSESQLKESNEPEFTGALEAKQTAEKHSEEAPKAFRQEEQGVLTKAQGAATATAGHGLEAMHGHRSKTLGAVTAGKGGAKGQDEAKRAEVSGKIESLYGKTKDEVTGILNGIDPQVDATFKSGEAQARTAFESYVDAKVSAYKDDRYSGLRGKYRWVRDKFKGLPGEVNQFYAQGRDLYLARMEGVIGAVADIVGRELTRAKDRIAAGQAQISQYVATLPADLQKVGKEAQTQIQGKFDELTQTVDSKQDDLVSDLAKKYVESRDAVDSRIKEMKDANKGLIDRAKDAVMGVINTIRKLKDMLLGVLAKVASVIGNIIAHPIKFLGHLVDGVKMGLTNFMSNIGEHLEKGLLGWLFGALGDAGLTMPEKFDLKGILSIIMQVLGLTYGHIRGLAVGIVGEEVVGHLEKSLEFFQVLIKEGPAGLWKWVVEKLADMKDVVMTKIQDFIQEKVIIAGIMWLIGLLNPVAAFIKACKAIYDIVMFFVDRATQVAELVNAIVDSVGAIAGGALGEAAGMVENALAKGIPVAIGFLASLLGLGGISDKIRSIIHTIQAPIHDIVTKVLGVVLKPFKWIGSKVKQGAAWAKKKVQQGVAFVKTKAKAGVAFVKGKAARFFGQGDDQKSAAVKAKAHEELTTRTKQPFKSVGDLQGVVHSVLSDLRPEGLTGLTAKPKSGASGKYQIVATASPPEVVDEADVEGGGSWNEEQAVHEVIAETQQSGTLAEAQAEALAAQKDRETKLSESSASLSLKVLREFIMRSNADPATQNEVWDIVDAKVQAALDARDGDAIFNRLREAQAAVNRLHGGVSITTKRTALQTHHHEEVHDNPGTSPQTALARRRLKKEVSDEAQKRIQAGFPAASAKEREEKLAELRRLIKEQMLDAKYGDLMEVAPLEEVDMIVMTPEIHRDIHKRREADAAEAGAAASVSKAMAGRIGAVIGSGATGRTDAGSDRPLRVNARLSVAGSVAHERGLPAGEREDSIKGSLQFGSSVARGGITVPGNAFGVEIPTFKVDSISWTIATASPNTVNLNGRVFVDCKWDVHDVGRTDIPNASTPAVTDKSWRAIYADLQPDSAGRPDRKHYWAEDITSRHEKFHANDDIGRARLYVPAAQAWLNSQSVRATNTDKDVEALMRKVQQDVQADAEAYYQAGGEDRAYGDGKDVYQQRVDGVHDRALKEGWQK